MNLDSLSFALSQISYSVANLNKKNYKSSISEISHLVAQHGAEADRHLFRCLFSHVDFTSDAKSSGKDFHQAQYLTQECSTLIAKPNFVSILCYAIDHPLHQQKTLKSSPQLFTQLKKILKLSLVQEVVFGLALLHSSNQETKNFAIQFVKQKLPHLLSSYIDADSSSSGEGGLQDTPIEVLHLLLSYLVHDKDQFGIATEQKDVFLKALHRDFPKERAPAVLAPLLYPEQTQELPLDKLSLESVNIAQTTMEGALADMIAEVGYGCTASVEECRNTLMQIGNRDITPASVARVLGMMAKNPTGLTDSIAVQNLSNPNSNNVWYEGKEGKEPSGPQTWNSEVFVQAVQEIMGAHMNWREVVSHLDYPGFKISDKQGFKLLIQALHKVLADNFPIEYIYRIWQEKEGQLSWISHSLKHPEVFCFLDFPFHPVAVDILKTPPDEENRNIAVWKSLQLSDTLLKLSESFYKEVLELFQFPVENCPDMLVLVILQIDPSWHTLKQELLSNLIPVFLGNHANSASVLHYAWHCQVQSSSIRTVVLHSMAEWYMRGEHDQSRLSRILDVAQDLKALSMLLNASPFVFVIDLACLASRREYLKLDKWLSDKISQHGEAFISACANFLKRRCPQLVSLKEEPQNKSQMLPPETLAIMLGCLQHCVGNVAPELAEMIRTMCTNASVILNKARQQAPPTTPVPVGPVGNKPSLGPNMPGLPPNNSTTGMPPNNMAPSSTIGMSASAGLPTLTNQMDPLGSMPPMGIGSSLTGSSGFPITASLGALNTTPGSPAKAFGQLGQGTLGTQVTPTSQGFSSFPSLTSHLQGNQTSQSQAFNMQNLTSQLQGLNMQNAGMPPTSSIPPPTTGLPPTSVLPQQARTTSLAGLSSQALKQQPPTVPNPSTTPNPTVPSGVGGSGDVSSILTPPSQQSQSFPKDIEDEANSYFQRIYNHPPHPTISIDEVLDMLRRFKESMVKKERDVFSCMLRNLFEEYRFFPQYPDKELHTTAVLFGGIIEQGLVTYMDLGIALRYVLEALKKPHGSKMYFFGIAALDRFKTRLKDYNQYCQYLSSIPHFQQFPQHLIEYVEYGSSGREPPNRPQGPVTSTITTTENPPVTTEAPVSAPVTTTAAVGPGIISKPTTALPNKPSIANATNIDTLLAGTDSKEEISVPPEAVQDKVFFVFNNLSLANMEQKSLELVDVVDEYMPWVSQYLVMKRASIEPNFHTLYANYIDHIKKAEFTLMVIKETYRNIKVLLRSDKGVANFSDRSLLKNLGHWLGMLSLAKNKPILMVDIDLKSLLYEAYHKGSQELLYVVPFVAKVLESCAKSKVFKPPNPWTMAIMNVLSELHQEQDLKLNLKFEIEVLCKTLSIDINDLHPMMYLKDPERMNTIEHQLSAPSKVKDSGTPQPEEPLAINIPTPTTAVVTSVPTAPSTTATTSIPVPPQPQFTYGEINVLSLAGLGPLLHINDQLPLFQANPHMKQCVKPSVERAVQELLAPVVERSIKIAVTTCEQIVKKDFALDPEENRMMVAARHMIKNMTAGMAMITCREPLLISINSNLKAAFLQAFRGATPAQKELIEEAARVIAEENTELACAFIQKTAVEKAIPEMDKRLANEFDLRKHARSEGRRYCDTQVLTYQAERMPEQIRLKVGGVTQQQIAVYEEFARNIPGFLPAPPEMPAANFPMKNAQGANVGSTDDLTHILDRIAAEIEQNLRTITMVPISSPQVVQLQTLFEAVVTARNNKDINTAQALLQKAVEGLLDGMNPAAPQHDPQFLIRYRDCHLLVLKGLQDHRAYGPQWTNKSVTRVLVECREEYKYNVEAVSCLIHSHLVSLQQYDLHLAAAMENGLNYMVVHFAMQLVQRFYLDEKHSSSTSEGDFYNTIETLARIAAHSRQAPEGLTNLIDTIRQHNDSGLLDRAPGGPTSMMHSGISQAREFDDPPGLHEKTEFLLREWVNMFHSPAAGRDSTKAFGAFVGQMHQQGILKTDDLITRFFRLCTEMCVDLCYRALAEQTHSATLVRAKCFHTLDAFVRLIALLVKHSGDTNNTVTKINLLNKVLGIVAGVLLQDHEVRNTEFQQLPYHRIFIMLFIELNAPEHVLESINYQVLTAFCNTFHILRPVKAPGFAYAWLELVSHRVFIGRMLAITPQQRGWTMYAQLLVDLFKFLSPFLRNAELSKPALMLYKGTLRVLLVLLHDFPVFLCDYHYAFCDVIPPNCIQMRNLILSAFPHNMRLPDPFTPNLKVDMLQEISHPPRIMTNYASLITPPAFKKDLDAYLKSRGPVTFLSELRSNLQVMATNDPGSRYNIPLINALVMYVGTQAINHIHNKGLTPSTSTIAHSSHMDIFQNLAVDLDTEGRYLFLNAIANQLRYPNSHTHYFSCTLLYLFVEANTEAIQEQITRVLLERLIVNRPHPWGLLVTFIELIKNPSFKFWNHEFVHCAPEIEKLFESVARWCTQTKQQQGMRDSDIAAEVH